MVRLTIRNGQAFSSITRELSQKNLVKHPLVLNAYAYMMRYDRRIHAGTYQFTRGERPKHIIEKLIRGDVLKISVTIPEGYSVRQIATTLKEEAGVESEKFLEAASERSFFEKWDIEASSLEGYLFPDTYWIPWGSGERAIIDMMVSRLEAVFDERLKKRAEALNMTKHEVLTLASIIEAETHLPEERQLVSAVYHNRLRKRMKLEADPTVAYAMGEYKGRLLFKDLLFVSPYNTYLNYGLPPGPICNPGEASIHAALYPDSTSKALYFVARGDGSHIFSLTLHEHKKAVQEVKRTRM